MAKAGNLTQALFDTTGYQTRQKLIADIEKITRRKLITYVTLNGPNAMIVHDDLSPIVDLLANFLPSDPIDLLLHSPGGLPDAAETLLRTGFRASNRAFRVIVPASAKSAATLLALGADEILMGDNSQLGPIDPQVFVPQLGMVLPAKAVISAYDTLTAKPVLNPGEITVAAQSLNAIFV
ncbi:MAG: SDH family Clp fold serine proteinase, partial [Sulfobacillus sp.]